MRQRTDTDARTDEYALATVLYEMLGGETPFSGPSPQAMLVRQLEGTVRPLVSIRPGLGSDRDHAIQRALSPNPHERYATVNEFLTALEEPSAGARVPWSRGRIKLLVGGVIAVALSVTIWQVVARQRQPTYLGTSRGRGKSDRPSFRQSGIGAALSGQSDRLRQPPHFDRAAA